MAYIHIVCAWTLKIIAHLRSTSALFFSLLRVIWMHFKCTQSRLQILFCKHVVSIRANIRCCASSNDRNFYTCVPSVSMLSRNALRCVLLRLENHALNVLFWDKNVECMDPGVIHELIDLDGERASRLYRIFTWKMGSRKISVHSDDGSNVG